MSDAKGTNDVRLVFSDMDSTYLAKDKTIPEGNLRLLDKLQERGIAFVPCSGRAWTALPKELLESPDVHYAVASNGAAVVDVRSGETLHKRIIGAERTLAYFERVKDVSSTFDVFAGGVSRANKDRCLRVLDYGISPDVIKFISTTRVRLDMPTEEVVRAYPDVDKVTMFFDSEEDRKALIAAAEADPSLSWTTSDPKNIEIMDSEASKGTGMAWLCDYLGVGLDQCVAFGDSANDLPMLEAAGLGVAMCNAADDFKAKADAVTAKDNSASGVACFLEDYLGL